MSDSLGDGRRPSSPAAPASGAGVETYRGFVYPWEMDHNGHLNVQFYVRRFDEATWHLFGALGVTAASLRADRAAAVALEQRIVYHAEVLAGALLVVRSRVVEVRPKVLRFAHEMHDLAAGRRTASMEIVGAYLDADARRARPLPAPFAAAAEQLLRGGAPSPG